MATAIIGAVALAPTFHHFLFDRARAPTRSQTESVAMSAVLFVHVGPHVFMSAILGIEVIGVPNDWIAVSLAAAISPTSVPEGDWDSHALLRVSDQRGPEAELLYVRPALPASALPVGAANVANDNSIYPRVWCSVSGNGFE
jgi:hypothetical protein